MYKNILIVLSFFVFVSCTKESNGSKINPNECIKAKLVLKGICQNYVIEVISGNIDPTLIEGTWQNPLTHDVYKNVFGLASICSFPSTLNEGDEFYFTVFNFMGIPEDFPPQDCVQCQAYSPMPDKRLFVTICSK